MAVGLVHGSAKMRDAHSWIFLGDAEVVMTDSPLSPEDERALVSRCAAGDAEAFDLLVSSFGGMIYNVAYRQLGDRDEALDLSQDVFIRVYRKIGTFRGDSSLKTWLFRIALNLSRNRQKWWRVRRRDKTVSIDARGPAGGGGDEGLSILDRLPDERHDPERAARSGDAARIVAEGLERLSFDHRQILVLRDIEELAYEEIAEILGISEGTVKSRISRARTQLKEVLAGRL